MAPIQETLKHLIKFNITRIQAYSLLIKDKFTYMLEIKHILKFAESGPI